MNRVRRHDDDRPARDELVGYRVESSGGPTGHIDSATRDTDERYLVVRTSRWPVQRCVVVPAGAINCIDPQRRTLWVERDRDEAASDVAECCPG